MPVGNNAYLKSIELRKENASLPAGVLFVDHSMDFRANPLIGRRDALESDSGIDRARWGKTGMGGFSRESRILLQGLGPRPAKG